MRLIDALAMAVRGAAVHDASVQAAPACILWPDGERQWENAVPRLQAEMPELLVLGDYDPSACRGPAIWLRCAITGRCLETPLPDGSIPILYLPGVSRQDLRAVDACPEFLRPLAELQYRGVLWSQASARDWTFLAFLKSNQGGLGLDVAMDDDTKEAMNRSLVRMLEEDVEAVKGMRLDADYFSQLLTGGDWRRNVLLWLDHEDAYRVGCGDDGWKAFAAETQAQLGLDPKLDGTLTAATRLATHVTDPWRAVWDRFCEAPNKYPNLPDRMRTAPMPDGGLFVTADTHGGWPQWNDAQEATLRHELVTLDDIPAVKARQRIQELEATHGARRRLPWAELGESPLACALQHLATLATVTGVSLARGSVRDIAEGYVASGWTADDAVLMALACVRQTADVAAVTSAVRALYLPWADECARQLQSLVCQNVYPGSVADQTTTEYGDSLCILFVDGLRFDAAKRLQAMVEAQGYRVVAQPTWVPLPSLTATGKPAVTPVRDKIHGGPDTVDFEPCVIATGQSLKGGYALKKLLEGAGWVVLEKGDVGAGHGHAWSAFGDIDKEGHDKGWKLAHRLDEVLADVRDRIMQLAAAGWKSIRVVTDHGWLLMPGGLPSVNLPVDLTDSKWGRCAALKPGAHVTELQYPWYWDQTQSFALARGISCYRAGMEYTHGGLSLQECLTLQLAVSPAPEEASHVLVHVTDVGWKGLRCTIAAEGFYAGLFLDIRTRPGDPQTSKVVQTKELKQGGAASVVVPDEDLQGAEAYIVLLNPEGEVVTQIPAVIGGTP